MHLIQYFCLKSGLTLRKSDQRFFSFIDIFSVVRECVIFTE